MSDESLEDPSVQAGEQADEEAGEEKGGESNGGWSCEICSTVVSINKYRGKCNPLANQCEAARKEDEDESWREKSSKVCLLFWKDPARSHLQVLGEAQGGGDDG